MAERNGSPHDTSRMLLENTSGDEGRLPEAKDSDTQTPQPSINRFRMIRDSVPESARLSSSDHTLHEVKTYTTDVVTQSCRENANQQPPLHLLKDLFQADINEALGEGSSLFLDRAALHISEEGDVGFVAGPNHFNSAVVTNPTRYIFRFGKSKNGTDALGAWSALPVELPGIEQHESIFERLPESIKNAGEYPVRCTPIIFRGFSENAKRRILEAAMKPKNRTLGPIDVSLEDGVIFATETGAAERKEKGNDRDVAGAGLSPAQSPGRSPEKEAEPEGEAKEGAPAPDSALAQATSVKRTVKINPDLPPAPMPSPVDRSKFEGFDQTLPPEPDTPFGDSEDPTTPRPSKQEDQPPSPSALSALFGVSNEKQSEVEITAAHVEEPARTANPEEVDAPAPQASSPQPSPGLEPLGPTTVQDSGRLTGVQTDEVEQEDVEGSRQEAVRESGGSEETPQGAGLDEVDQTSSTPAPVSSVDISDPAVVPSQQPATAGGIQPGSTTEANLWAPISALILVFVLPLIVAVAERPSSREHRQVSINAQNDIEGAAPSQSRAPELGEATLDAEPSGIREPNADGPGDRSRPALAPHTRDQVEPLTEDEPNPAITAEPPSSLSQQEPVTEEPAASQVAAQVPYNEETPVSNFSSDSEEAEVQEPTEPASTAHNPSTPAGIRRSRPKKSPPSAESHRRPPKRLRGEFSGDRAEVEGDIQPPGPLSSPVFETANAEPGEGGEPQMTQTDDDLPGTIPAQAPTFHQADFNATNQEEEPDEVNSLHSASTPAGRTTPQGQPSASEQIQSSESDPDTSMETAPAPDPHGKGKGRALSPPKNPAASLRGTGTSSPPVMEWDPDVFPKSDPISPTQPLPNPRSAEGMEIDQEAPGPSFAGVAGPSNAIQVDTAGGMGLQTTSGRRIKRLRLITRRPQPTSTPSNHQPQTDVPMAIDEVGTIVPTQGSSFPSYPPPPPPAAVLATVGPDDSAHDAPVTDSAGSYHEGATETSEESLSERDSPAPNEEGNVIPTEQSAGEVDELDSDDEPLDLPRGSSPADRGGSQENNVDHHAATADHEAESTDDGSDFSDDVHEAKASKYSLSNASAAAEIEKELGETSDTEIQPQAPVERRGPSLSASTAAFGLAESVGTRAGRSTSPTARLASISSALRSYSISGLIDAGGPSAVSPAGGEPAVEDDDEDFSPLL